MILEDSKIWRKLHMIMDMFIDLINICYIILN